MVERHPFRLDDAATYPLFTPELIEMMRDLLSSSHQEEVATSITVRARKPA